MTITDKPVAAQYESWVYPNPVMDMADAIAKQTYSDMSDPSRIRRKLWPKKVEPDALDILIAGCGANQAAYLAMTNPASRVVGIDLSAASLAHEHYLKEKHFIANLELHQLNLEDVSSLGQSFDLIVSSGVLHHLPDPNAGLRALGNVLRPHGVIFLMLYGLYPRVGVHMLQEAFRIMGLRQSAEDVEMVKHTLSHVLPQRHHINSYNDPDRGFDAGLVDTYLHAREKAYTVPDIVQMISECDLKFQGWADNYDYSLSRIIPDRQDPLRLAIENVPKLKQWQCVELIGQSHARHFPLVCHLERPEADYTLDFTGEAWLDYVPSLRYQVKIVGERLARPGEDAVVRSLSYSRFGGPVTLDAFEGTLFRRIDGRRTINELLDNEHRAAAISRQRVERARVFFQELADLDHVLFEIP